MSALQSALAVIRASAADGTTAGLFGVECAALAQHIDRLTADLAEARRQVQAACCGPWHERETTEADAAAFPWQRVKAAREVAARWHSHAHWQASQGPREATVAWAVAQTVLSLVLDELDYDGIDPRAGQETDPAVVPGRQDTPAETPPLAFADEGGAVHYARDDDAPSCRDCGTWPCTRHATNEDRAEYAAAESEPER